MRKKRFRPVEKCVVWKTHGARCWFCTEPLRFLDCTVDHLIPERLVERDGERRAILNELGLPDDFEINSYTNWLPCHSRCNSEKGPAILRLSPRLQLVLERLSAKAQDAERLHRTMTASPAKDKLFARLMAAVEGGTVTIGELQAVLNDFAAEPGEFESPDDIILLEGSRFVYRREIVAVHECRCGRDVCASGRPNARCYFTSDLPDWVIRTGLHRSCYEEKVACPRCGSTHKRGHVVGWPDACRQESGQQDA